MCSKKRVYSRKTSSGFTLVELSIVIVIIGLIVAGVVGGQSLVQQSRLRAIISEKEQVSVALNAFKLEFGAIPGDFSTAASYWTTGCNAAASGASVTADCNGDSNRRILMAAGNTGESYMAWRHLSYANLFPGSFVPGAVITGSLGNNIPVSKFSTAGMTLVFDESTTIFATAGDGATSGGRNAGVNVLIFGGAVASNIANGTVFSVNQVKGLDDKSDDGNPMTGSLIAVGAAAAAGAGGTNCVDTGTVGYNIDSSDATPCAVAFKL